MSTQSVRWLLILKSSSSMLFLPNDKMFPNKFIEVHLPTKAQIFARTGQHAVSGGSYSGEDNPVRFGSSKTESAEAFARAAEAFEPQVDESKEGSSHA